MRFSYLDGLRGLAAFFVLAFHWESLFKFSFSKSYLAVDLFFLLSGFVIAHAYDAKVGSGKMSPGSFMFQRLTRLYPLYAFAVVFSVSLVIVPAIFGRPSSATPGEWLSAGLFALFFLPIGIPGSNGLFPMNGSFWSLAMELLVNLVYAYTRKAVTHAALLSLVIFSGIGLVLIAMYTGSLGHGFNFEAISLAGGLLRTFFGIGFGMLLYHYRHRFVRVNQHVPAWFSFPVVAMVLMAPRMQHGWLFDLLGVFVVLPLAIVIASGSEPSRAWQVRALQALGIGSYPLYLLHTPVLKLVTRAGNALPGREWIAGTLAASLLFYLCLQLDKRFDIPAREWLRSIRLRYRLKRV